MLAGLFAMNIHNPAPRSVSGQGLQQTSHRSASPSKFILQQDENNDQSLSLSRLIAGSAFGSLAERTGSPPPSYDGLTGRLLETSPVGTNSPDQPASPTSDRGLPPQLLNSGWSEVDFVSRKFLSENLPGWESKISNKGYKSAAQEKQLARVKARIRKSGKELILHLFRRTPENDEVAEIRLGGQAPPATTDPPEIAELEAPPVLCEAPADTAIHQLPAEDNQVSPDSALPSSIVPTPARGLSVQRPVRRVVHPRGEAASDSDSNQIRPLDPLNDDSFTRRLRDALRQLSASDLSRLANSAPTEETPFSSLNSRMVQERADDATPLTPEATAVGFSPVQRLPSVRTRNNAQSSKEQSTGNPAKDTDPDSPSSSHQVTSTHPKEVQEGKDTAAVKPLERGVEAAPDATEGNVEQAMVLSSSVKNVPKSTSPSLDLTLASVAPVQPAASYLLSGVGGKFESPKLGISTDCSPEAGPTKSDRVTSQTDRAQPSNAAPVTPVANTSGESTMEWTLPTINIPAPESPTNVWLPSFSEVRPAPQPQNAMYSFLRHASTAALSQLFKLAAGIYERYGPEKPIPENHVRVRWTCTCGAHLFDDYIERRRGAAREFEAYLNRPRAHAPTTPSTSANTTPNSTQIWSSNASLATPSPATTFSSQVGDISPTNYSPTMIRGNNPFLVHVGNQEQRWLLTCAEEGEFTIKLSHVDVTDGKIRSDKDLAMEIRKLYAHVNRKWWRVLRLRGLTSIKFVQFEAHRNRVVDIRKCPDMPPKNRQYEYEHAPDDLIPPVGNAYLMHLLLHPEDYDNEVIAYARFPKKRGLKIEGGLGWGINLVEGFLADRVWSLVMVFFVLGSLAFAVVWAVKKDDVQGAFGVASWILTLAVLLVGWAQASFG